MQRCITNRKHEDNSFNIFEVLARVVVARLIACLTSWGKFELYKEMLTMLLSRSMG